MSLTRYEDWPTKPVKVSNLRLDPENPRLRRPHPDNDQRTIAKELLERENVESLAKDIVEQGYHPIETLLVMKSGRNFTVLEGNRRTAALKMLLNPLFAPQEKKSRFEALKGDGAGRIPDSVRVVIAPSRTSARPIILSRHTHGNIEQWKPIAKAPYIDSMVADGFTPESIARTMGVNLSDFLRRFRDAKLHELAASMDLKAEVRQVVEDPKKFKPSTLQRIVESVEGRKWLGIAPHDEKGWIITSKTDEFRKAFTQIVEDAVNKKSTPERSIRMLTLKATYSRCEERSPQPKKDARRAPRRLQKREGKPRT